MLEFDVPRTLPADIFADVFGSAGKQTAAPLIPCLLSAGDLFAPDVRARFLAEVDRFYADEIGRLLTFWSVRNPDLSEDQALDLAAALTAVPDPACAVLFYRALMHRNSAKAENFRKKVLNMLDADADGFARMALDDTLRAPQPISGRVPPKAFPAMALCASLKPDGVDFNLLAEGVAAMLGRKWIAACDEALDKFVAAIEKGNLPVLAFSDIIGFGRLAAAVRSCYRGGRAVPENAFRLFERLSQRQSRADAETTRSCLWFLRHAPLAEKLRRLLNARDFEGVNALAETVSVEPGVSYPNVSTGSNRLVPDFVEAVAEGNCRIFSGDGRPLLTENAAELLITFGLDEETAALWRLPITVLAKEISRRVGNGADMAVLLSVFSESQWRSASCGAESLPEQTPWEDLPSRYVYAFRSVIPDYENLVRSMINTADRLERTLRGVKGLTAAGCHFFHRALTATARAEALMLIGTEAWREAGGEMLHMAEGSLSGGGTRAKRENTFWDDLYAAFKMTEDQTILGRLAAVLLPKYPNMRGFSERENNDAMLSKAVWYGAVTDEMLRTGMSVRVFKNFLKQNFYNSAISAIKKQNQLGKDYQTAAWDVISDKMSDPKSIAFDIFERKAAGIGPYRGYTTKSGRSETLALAIRILQSKNPVRRAARPVSVKEAAVQRQSVELAAVMVRKADISLSSVLRFLAYLDFRHVPLLERYLADMEGFEKLKLSDRRLQALQQHICEKIPRLQRVMDLDPETLTDIDLAERVWSDLKEQGIDDRVVAYTATYMVFRGRQEKVEQAREARRSS